MSKKNKGKEPPAFLSTHPSSKKRIENLNNWITEVIIKYPPIKVVVLYDILALGLVIITS